MRCKLTPYYVILLGYPLRRKTFNLDFWKVIKFRNALREKYNHYFKHYLMSTGLYQLYPEDGTSNVQYILQKMHYDNNKCFKELTFMIACLRIRNSYQIGVSKEAFAIYLEGQQERACRIPTPDFQHYSMDSYTPKAFKKSYLKKLFMAIKNNYKDYMFSLYHFNKACVSKDNEFIINATITLESLLLKDDEKQEINLTLTYRGMYALSQSNHNNLDMTYHLLKRLYKLRSRIVHNGKIIIIDSKCSNILTELGIKDWLEFKEIVLSILAKLIYYFLNQNKKRTIIIDEIDSNIRKKITQ